MNEITVGCEASFLSGGRVGRALMGRVTEVSPSTNDTAVVLVVTSYEDRRDRKLVGSRYSVPMRYLTRS